MFFRALFLLLGLAACAPQYVGTSTGRARFPAYPDAFFTAFRNACDGPAESFQQIRGGIHECRRLLPPDTTASLILAYGGTIQELPELVIRFTATPDGSEFIVANDIYVRVPRENADTVVVRQPDREVLRALDTLYVQAGGVPE